MSENLKFLGARNILLIGQFPMDSPETSNISCKANPSSPLGVKKVVVSGLYISNIAKKWYMLCGIPYCTALTAVERRDCCSGLSKCLSTNSTKGCHQAFSWEWIHPMGLKSAAKKFPPIASNSLRKVSPFSGLSPIGNSCFVKPGCNPSITLDPTGRALRLMITPVVTPPWDLVKSQSIVRGIDRGCM